MAPKILLINGPNLNLLGMREPSIYGHETLDDVQNAAVKQAKYAGATVMTHQSSHEGGIVGRIHQARQENIDFIVINPGAYTHTSIAIRDALVGVSIKFIEIHITNVHARDAFRHHSYLSDKAVAVI